MDALDPSTSSPIRIALAITDLETGGAERCLVELATRLDRRQFAPVVYCLGPRPAGNPSSLADKLEDAGVTVHCFAARRWTDLGRVSAHLRRQMAADAPRVVQTFLFHANVLAAWAARRAGVERVVTGIRVAEHRAAWHLVGARLADRFVDRHVCVSQSVRDYSVQRGRLPCEKLVVIPNGVDVERFAAAKPALPSSLGVAPGRWVIVSLGRLDEQKGFDWLLEAMPRAFAELPDHDLVLVGEGPERTRLAALAERLGITPRVHFTGFRRDVPEILSASDLLVLSSRWEGMPNAVLEAMAAGRPVVATNVAGVAELLGNPAAEQICPPNDPRQFVDDLVAILRDSQLAARLGRENQERARADFGLSAMVEAYQRLYLALLSGDA
jgi:glycosyltransferase involved in cell wall biosynthesis